MLLPNFKEENFKDLEPLDCRKRRFQSLNFTFFGTLFQVYYLIPQIFAQLMLKICPTAPPAPPPRLVRLWVRAVHRHRTGVGSIPAGGPYSWWIFLLYQNSLHRVKCHKIIMIYHYEKGLLRLS